MKKILSIIGLFLLGVSLVGCEPVTYESVQEDYTNYLEQHNDAYESIMLFYNELNNEWIKGVITVKSAIGSLDYSAVGSGFIYAEDENYYYALTNSHVIGGDMRFNHIIKAIDAYGVSYDASLIAYETDYDLATIRFSKGSNDLLYIPFSLVNPEYRDIVSVLGHPNGQVNAINIGYYTDLTTVSLSDQAIGTVRFPVLRLDVPVEPGSSGSVVMNEDYQVVGVVFAGSYDDDSSIATRSFAIPIEKVYEYLEDNDLMAGDLS